MPPGLSHAAIAAFAWIVTGLPVFAETPPLTQTSTTTGSPVDPNLWLEEIEGPRALAWVKQQNARSLAVLEGDPAYASLHQSALDIVNATDRIPMPELIGRHVYNLWQDPRNVRGLWRRASQADYAKAAPAWETVLDLDALSTTEKANWIWKGANCPPPSHKRCMIALSNGGEDATEEREFDLETRTFTPGGFHLPRSKQDVDWLDDDTLILDRDWGPGTLTQSGYGFVIKTLRRGQSLDRAEEVFRGQASDVAASANVLHDAQGRKLVLISRATDFFHTEYYQLTDHGAVRLALPQKATVHGLIDGLLVFSAEEDWLFQGRTFKAGSLIALSPDSLGPSPAVISAPTPSAARLFEPGPRQSIEQVAVTATCVVAAIYDNVRGGLVAFHRGAGGWIEARLPTAANSSVSIATASDLDDTLYYTVENFLEPTRLWRANVADGAADTVKTLPARFDASRDEVEQFEVASSDGTMIPYFVVHPKGMTLDGNNPTLLYAYGGFQASMLPAYSAAMGKLWLERGGSYVLANIRGGGEFGPGWHEAGLKTHRQRIYDDFAAVGRDLIARKITSPRRLGIEGGSNGGLLMGVEFNQHPELWHAVVIQVPLLDMLRFEQIGAGASWVGEYGSVSNPAEAAFLASISPYHNLRAGVAYPEPFFVTSTKDDRVTPVHARKMAARMEAMGLPFLYFENTNGGHAASANLQERAMRIALEFTYLSRKLMN
jgi:prolyl oligopeptidase